MPQRDQPDRTDIIRRSGIRGDLIEPSGGFRRPNLLTHAASRLVGAVSRLATAHPDDGPAAAFTLTDAYGHQGGPVQLGTLHLRWIADAATAGRVESDRAHTDHPHQGLCAWCQPEPGPDGQEAVVRAIDAIGALVSHYPTGNGATSTFRLTAADGTLCTAPLDPGQVTWLAALIETAHEQVDRGHDDHPLAGVCVRCGHQEQHNPYDEDEGPEPSLSLEEMLTRLAQTQDRSRPHPPTPHWGIEPTVEVGPASFLTVPDTAATGLTRSVAGVRVPAQRALGAPVIDTAGTRWAGEYWTRPGAAYDRLAGMAEDGHHCLAYIPEAPLTDDPHGGDDCSTPFTAGITYHRIEHPHPLGRLYTTHVWCAYGHDASWSTDGG